MPFISQISQAKQNREIKDTNIDTVTTLVRIVCCVGIAWFEFAKIKDANIILRVKSPTVKAAKFKGFTVICDERTK